jgi:BASS family bile acid:Na+ symporter
MAVGLACPQLHRFAWAIRPGIMAMLFLAFFAMPRTRSIVHPAHLRLLLAGPLLALLVFLALRPFDVDLAVAGALVALTPSATASPVVTALLGGDADWVGVSVLLTNSVFPLLAALCLPPLLGGRAGHGWIGPPLATLATLAVPALLAVAGRRFLPAPVREGILARRGWSFWLWVAVLVPTMAGASDYLHHSGTGWLRASSFAGLSLLLCAAMFALGRRLGGKGLGLEASQAFGQKNTLFSLWFAAAYLSPGISLAPAAYVLWHNLWNAWQLQRVRRPPSPSPKD